MSIDATHNHRSAKTVAHVCRVPMEPFHVDVHRRIAATTVNKLWHNQVLRFSVKRCSHVDRQSLLAICSSMPCRNNATCIALNNNANFYCQCSKEYTGSTCCRSTTEAVRIEMSSRRGIMNERDFIRSLVFSNAGDHLSTGLLQEQWTMYVRLHSEPLAMCLPGNIRWSILRNSHW